MGKKRKGRSVRKNQQILEEPEDLIQAPHSFVIHRGLAGGYITNITKDFRNVMEPFTATHLKERKKNTIKDFVSLSGFLHVSHLCIFTQTELGVYLKLAKLPRGPTLTFKAHSFTLAKDVISSLKKQYVYSELFKHSPLMVLNSFSGEGMHLKLMATTFQNMFPTINLTNVNLNNIRRCVLLNYNPQTKLIDFRHYAIKAIPVGVSKGVKKVVQGKVPNLSRCNDISDFLTKSAILSESEFEDDPNNHVTLPQKLSTRGAMQNSQSAIRLSELGPRLTLQLMKVEDGLLDGEVLFHELVHKTEEEAEAIRKKRDQKKKLKESRKNQQEVNTKKKQEKKEELKQKSLKGMQQKDQKQNKETESDRLMKRAVVEANRETRQDDDDDVEYYRQEVGEEPEQGMFSANNNRKRAYVPKNYRSKKPKLDETVKDKKFDSKFGKNKFRKFNDDKPKSKWPGGRGSHPKYGFKTDKTENKDSKTPKKGTRIPNKGSRKPMANKSNKKTKRR